VIAASTGFVLSAPAWLWLLPLLVVAAWLRWRHLERTHFAPAWLFRDPSSPAPLPRTARARCWLLPALLHTAMLALVVVAMARPVVLREVAADPPGRTILLCLDHSSSMAADDLAPGRTRHDVGREVAAAFVRARPQDRVGFVSFARYSDLRCPPTRDHDACTELLAALPMVERDGPEDATAIGAAVATAAASLERSPGGGKVVVVVTDGEENVAHELAPDEIAPLHAAQLCAAAGIRVHTIQVGSGNRKPDGRVVPVDTTAVQQLAATTGGRHFTAGDARALAAVYAAIDRLETAPPPPPKLVEREWYPAVLAVALGLAALARCLSVLWLRRSW